MKLSAPIHVLKRQARLAARQAGMPLHQALDEAARREGYSGWSLLAARHTANPAAPEQLFAGLAPGELVLIGARPGQGKTLLGLKLAIEAVQAGREAFFFTLEYSPADVLQRLHSLKADVSALNTAFRLDCSDTICAGTIIATLANAAAGTVAVVDYLQLLDQKRDNPPVADQIGSLQRFARQSGMILVFLAQIHRSFDPQARACPDASDIRLPNPVDLGRFDRMYFLHDGNIAMRKPASAASGSAGHPA